MSASIVDLEGLRELLAAGAQLVEVLPREEYEELHLPGAISIPLKQLDAAAAEQLDRERPLVVYCWDALCDMSPRAAARLRALGFTQVHDYAVGKVDWLAHGLPVEGRDAGVPTAGSLARDDGATCAPGARAAGVLAAIAASPYGYALVLDADRVVLGRVRRSALQDLAPDGTIDAAIEPGPSTVRAHVSAAELRERLTHSDVRSFLVTRPDGTLLGIVGAEQLGS